jgi:hypothetical protein
MITPFNVVHVLYRCTTAGYGELFRPKDIARLINDVHQHCLAAQNIFLVQSQVAAGK